MCASANLFCLYKTKVEWDEADDDTEHEIHRSSSTSQSKTGSDREEKATILIRLKREAVFSSPLDIEGDRVSFKAFSKTEEERSFLRSAMQKHLLFEELSPEELHQLIEVTEKVQVSRGEKVVHQSAAVSKFAFADRLTGTKAPFFSCSSPSPQHKSSQ